MENEKIHIFTLSIMSPWIGSTTVTSMFRQNEFNESDYFLDVNIFNYSHKKNFTLQLPKDTGNEIMSLLDSINISLCPPQICAYDGEEYYLVLSNWENKISLRWTTEQTDRWKELVPFIKKIKQLIPND